MKKPRNRKIRKQSVASSWKPLSAVGALLAIGFCAFYFICQSKGEALMREMAALEKKLERREADAVRESARWGAMLTPERLSEKLLRFGLEMRYAKQDQVVRMGADGAPAPGQVAVHRARQRAREGMLAGAGDAAQGARGGARKKSARR